MVEILKDSRLCTGCAACGQVCPQGAIEMKSNEEGFLYPVINTDRCSDCGLCQKTCPVNAAISGQTGKPSIDVKADERHRVYACFSRDEEVRLKSTSGGVFTHLAKDILSKGGVVFGAGFDQKFRVQHCYVERAEELDGLRRSKYVQSNTGSSFKDAKGFLNAGRQVLFTGTPCQIAGLKAYLGREYENLLTCDLACHGVPSPKVWDMFLQYIQARYNSAIKTVSFRDKATGWSESSMRIAFEDGREYLDSVKRETYFMGFGKSIFNRTSCYSCNFRLQNTRADITLADFWGIDKSDDSDFKDNRGVSLIITHTEAGEKAISSIGDGICVKPRSLEEAIKGNPRLVSSVSEPNGRSSFFGDMKSGCDFDRLRRKYMDNYSLKYKAKKMVKQMLMPWF